VVVDPHPQKVTLKRRRVDHLTLPLGLNNQVITELLEVFTFTHRTKPPRHITINIIRMEKRINNCMCTIERQIITIQGDIIQILSCSFITMDTATISTTIHMGTTSTQLIHNKLQVRVAAVEVEVLLVPSYVAAAACVSLQLLATRDGAIRVKVVEKTAKDLSMKRLLSSKNML
jgi:hypothetical protein